MTVYEMFNIRCIYSKINKCICFKSESGKYILQFYNHPLNRSEFCYDLDKILSHCFSGPRLQCYSCVNATSNEECNSLPVQTCSPDMQVYSNALTHIVNSIIISICISWPFYICSTNQPTKGETLFWCSSLWHWHWHNFLSDLDPVFKVTESHRSCQIGC